MFDKDIDKEELLAIYDELSEFEKAESLKSVRRIKSAFNSTCCNDFFSQYNTMVTLALPGCSYIFVIVLIGSEKTFKLPFADLVKKASSAQYDATRNIGLKNCGSFTNLRIFFAEKLP